MTMRTKQAWGELRAVALVMGVLLAAGVVVANSPSLASRGWGTLQSAPRQAAGGAPLTL